MTFVRLPEPEPLSSPKLHSPFVFPRDQIRYLPVPDTTESPGVFQVLDRRVTRRTFEEVRESDLSQLFWHTAKVRGMRHLTDWNFWQHRSVPSAGGKHAIHILVLAQENDRWRVSAYEPLAHALLGLDSLATTVIDDFVGELEKVVPPQRGTILVFVADYERMLQSYSNAESLVWRDAGVLIMGLAVVAEALDLSFCPLGITAQTFVDAAFGCPTLGGVGACVVGGTF